MINRFLLTVTLALPASAQDAGELLKNPKFEAGLDGWQFIYHRNEYREMKSPRVARPVKDGALPVVSVPNPRKAGRHYLRLDQDVELEEGRSYRFVVEARYQGEPGHFWAAVQMKGLPWKNYGLLGKYPVTAQWQRFESVFTMKPVDSDNPPCLRLYFGDLKGTTHIRNCSLVGISGGPFAKTGTKVTPLENPESAAPKNYTAVEVDLDKMAGAFAGNAASAAKEYGGKVLKIEGYITGTGKSIKPGTFALELNYGGVRAVVGDKEFGAKEFAALQKNLRGVRKRLRDAERKAKKDKNAKQRSRAEQKAYELDAYPGLSCEGKFAHFRNKVIEISPTRLVQVNLSTD